MSFTDNTYRQQIKVVQLATYMIYLKGLLKTINRPLEHRYIKDDAGVNRMPETALPASGMEPLKGRLINLFAL